MKAIWNGKVIAESDRTVEVHGYHYFPREAVRMEMLTPAPREGSDLECPHGVQFYDVASGKAKSSRAAEPPSTKQEARISRRAAWSYEKPRAAMKQVDHWIGFWEDVEVA